MNKKCYYLILLLLLFAINISILFANAVIVDFRAEAGKNKAVLRWSTLSETNCKEFVIERSLDQQNFKKVGTVTGSGNSSERKDYEFLDKTVFRTAGNTFYYRIKIVDGNGNETTFSEGVSVTPSISGVFRHTWGSIKAMFR